MKSQKVRDMPVIERPREKLIRYGPDRLSTQELIAILLRTGTKQYTLQTLSKSIETRLKELETFDVTSIQKIPGIGPAKACELIASIELGKRLLMKKKTELMLDPESVWTYVEDIRGQKKEYFVTIFLDTRNQAIKKEIISVGTLNESLVHPREVFEPAIQNSASSVILVHNHPSQSTEPSLADLHITKRLIKAGLILGIDILDHVIVTKSGWFSFKDHGLIRERE